MPDAAKVYSMLGNENLWDVASEVQGALNEAGIDYAICGGVAVCLHGYQRNTVDLDLVIQPDDAALIKSTLIAAGLTWQADRTEFRSSSGIAVQFLYAGDRAGRGSQVVVTEPKGAENVELIEGLPVLRLSKLIEMKLACGASNVRRMHKDFADVVELIAARQLDKSFARFLHKSVRPEFRQLVGYVGD